MRRAGSLSDQDLYKMDVIKFQEVRGPISNRVQIIYWSCSWPSCRVCGSRADELLRSLGKHSAAAACSVYEGEPLLARCRWVRRCVIHHREHKQPTNPARKVFIYFDRLFLLQFLFPKNNDDRKSSPFLSSCKTEIPHQRPSGDLHQVY